MENDDGVNTSLGIFMTRMGHEVNTSFQVLSADEQILGDVEKDADSHKSDTDFCRPEEC
jgi:hypothetical protein